MTAEVRALRETIKELVTSQSPANATNSLEKLLNPLRTDLKALSETHRDLLSAAKKGEASPQVLIRLDAFASSLTKLESHLTLLDERFQAASTQQKAALEAVKAVVESAQAPSASPPPGDEWEGEFAALHAAIAALDARIGKANPLQSQEQADKPEPSAGVTPTVLLAPRPFESTIRAIHATGDLVAISIPTTQTLTVGDVLYVTRGQRQIGTAHVTRVAAERGFAAARLADILADENVKPGDRVSSSPPHSDSGAEPSRKD